MATVDEARAAVVEVIDSYDNCCGFFQSSSPYAGCPDNSFGQILAVLLDAFEKAVKAGLPCYHAAMCGDDCDHYEFCGDGRGTACPSCEARR